MCPWTVTRVFISCLLGKSAATLPVCPVLIEGLPRIAEACPNLRRCVVEWGILVASLRALFVVPKLKLVHLEINVRDANILQVFAEEVTTLEDWEYEGPMPPHHLVSQVVTANC